MKDFLQFKHFISEDILIVFYTVGALVLPIVMWIVLFWVLRRYRILERFYKNGAKAIIIMFIVWVIKKVKIFDKYMAKKITWKNFSLVQKLKIILVFLLLLTFAELFWRMLLEYLIAFMQIHESLQK